MSARDEIRLALFGGIYSNHYALAAALKDATARGVDQIFCLGDLGAFGPHPDRVFPLLNAYQVACIQGNYDDSVGHGLTDCQCGYTDPRDNYFAQISYDYTLSHTSVSNREFLRGLPREKRLELGRWRLLLCHGSPRRTNEFLWESATSDHFLEHLFTSHSADLIATTHTGLKWQRRVGDHRLFVNVGVLGRPENDGRTHVWYTLLHVNSLAITAEFIPVSYDHQALAVEMQQEGLPDEFVATILTGWWTSCLEILPAKERLRGRY